MHYQLVDNTISKTWNQILPTAVLFPSFLEQSETQKILIALIASLR